MPIFNLAVAVQYPINTISQYCSGTFLFGNATIENTTHTLSSNTPSALPPLKYTASQLLHAPLPSLRNAATGFAGALAAHYTAQIPREWARGIISGANFFAALQKATEIVRQWPTFIAASNAEKAKMILTELVPILVSISASVFISEPGKMVGYILIPPILDYLLNHVLPNSTDTRTLAVTTPLQMINKFGSYEFIYHLVVLPPGLRLLEIPCRKSASEFLFRNLETLSHMVKKGSLDDPNQITVPTLSATYGTPSYEITTLVNTLLASIHVNNLIFFCDLLSKSTGLHGPSINNTIGVLATVWNSTISVSLFGIMSKSLGLKPESTTYTRQEPFKYTYKDGNKRIADKENSEDALAATMFNTNIMPSVYLVSDVVLTKFTDMQHDESVKDVV